jgi:hypothetical protein
VTTHAIRLFRLSGELSHLVSRHPRTPICSEPAPSLFLGQPSRRFTEVRKNVNRCIGFKAPAVCERAAVDRVHKLCHLRLGGSVVAGNGKGPAIGGSRRSGAIAQMEEVEGDLLASGVQSVERGVFRVSGDPTSDVVPEPTTFILLGTGLGALGLAAWRRKK